MSVTVDDQPLHADELGFTTLGQVLSHLQQNNRLVVHVLIDGRWDFVGAPNTRRIVKGDATCLSIAAASVLAKVTRDRVMRGEAPHFPGYDFELNKGYPCPRHKMSLRAWGPTSIHRRSWVFMDHLIWGSRYRRPGMDVELPFPDGSGSAAG